MSSPRIILHYDEEKELWSIGGVENKEALEEELREIGEPCELDELLDLLLHLLNCDAGMAVAERIAQHEDALDILLRAAGLEELARERR
jgi:hypothetical protein